MSVDLNKLCLGPLANMEWRPSWCTETRLEELKSIFIQMLSFVSSDQYDRLLRERKRSVVEKVFIGLHLV